MSSSEKIRTKYYTTEENNEYMNIIECVTDEYEIIVHVDLDTGHEKRYKSEGPFSEIFEDENLVYYERSQKFLDKYVYEEDRKEFIKAHDKKKIAKVLSEGKAYYITFRMHRGDKVEWMEERYVRHKAHVNHNCAIVTIKNINNEKEQEEKMAAQQKALEEALMMAQSANRAKTTFLNNMSHDIRTPMNAIIGFTSLAASHISSEELVKDYLAKISQSSEHLLSLINDVLDMSKIESGKMRIVEREEDLSEILHTLRNIVQSDIHAKQIDFFMDCIDVKDEKVLCDKLRLNQVLLNVLSNAIKYTDVRGMITLRISQMGVTKSGYGIYEFRIKDNGMGMSREFLKTIFDPFTRVESSTVSGIQGTGLGMSITKNIVDMMGGSIDIVSEPNVGTEVILKFQFKLLKEKAIIKKIEELEGLRGLVVDDDINACQSTSTMLWDIGMRPEWCVTGKEAIVRASEAYRRGDSFKVYIIDWLMPDINGIETTRRIRKVIGEDAPIIILTSYDWSDIETEAREAGVTAFINKPLFPSDLRRVLASCCNLEIEIDEIPNIEKFDFGGKRVLLVEDNQLNREIAKELLEEEKIEVEEAFDGKDAIEKIESKILEGKEDFYDAILMDIQMPVMNGYEATRKIRKIKNLTVKHIPIIALSANAFEEDRQKSFEAGMNGHIAKPIKMEELLKELALLWK